MGTTPEDRRRAKSLSAANTAARRRSEGQRQVAFWITADDVKRILSLGSGLTSTARRLLLDKVRDEGGA
jgi:hypothetical protein